MKRNQLSRIAGAPDRSSSLRMSAIERARAEEGMHQAMALANLALAGAARVRHAFNSVSQAMYVAYGRGRV